MLAPGLALPSSAFPHSGDAPWARRHPPSMAGGGSRGIHAARPTPRHLRSACTQVAIGGVWAIAHEDQNQEQRIFDRSHAPRGNAAPDALRPLVVTRSVTGFMPTRSVGTINTPNTEWLLILLLSARQIRRHTSRLGCRLNAGGVEWAERHGCRESAARTWMSFRRGPTERRRSEGIPTKEEPNQEQGHLVTWCLFK
ncbi:hypothetical protein BWR59_04565 [Pseudomonas sp. Bc-h]|nr:hypothetical protein BWR59_04565 [Pseudomonas sp. Bc-h]